ncbi:MAG: hypothetical protein M3R24_22320 [Chloroflexota bacterium]|nr:hypothetical protein [Chloroflexota bacterium]
MASPIMIVPGKNVVLHYVARQMEGLGDVMVLGTANDALWQSRQTPPRIVLADVQLDDMSGAELAEILPNFAPNTRILICGRAVPATVAQVQALGAEFVALDGSSAEAVRTVYEVLDMAPPPTLPTTGDLREAPPARAQVVAPPSAAAVTPPAKAAVPPKPESATPSASPARTQPTKAAAPPSAAPRLDGFAKGGALVIQPQQYQVLMRLLDVVAKEVGAQSVLLIDPAGMVLVQSGTLPGVVMELIGPMVATSFSTTSQLARHLQDQNTNATYVHEGDHYDIYAFNISYRVSLLIMFDKRINPGKLGTVWVYAKRAMKQLQQILKL